jgi:hypothetical protein
MDFAQFAGRPAAPADAVYPLANTFSNAFSCLALDK